jgi:hypothetical protein
VHGLLLELLRSTAAVAPKAWLRRLGAGARGALLLLRFDAAVVATAGAVGVWLRGSESPVQSTLR